MECSECPGRGEIVESSERAPDQGGGVLSGRLVAPRTQLAFAGSFVLLRRR
jgi:hypothetical protein